MKFRFERAAMADVTETFVRCSQCGRKAILRLTASLKGNPQTEWAECLCESHWYERLDTEQK
jgi:hypothetical protein